MDLDDGRGQQWTFTIMAHVLSPDQYVLDEKIGAVLEISPMYLPLAAKTEIEE